MTIEEQINVVVEAREKARGLTERKTEAYQKWVSSHWLLIEDEKIAKVGLIEAEGELRASAIALWVETGEKSIAPGVGIRVRTVLNYEAKEAMGWAVKHELALKLDTSAFEKIAKTSNLPFVTITDEPSATIATELARVD